jgi:hypothetical protein
MLQGSQPSHQMRQDRQSVDTGMGEKRLAQGRVSHISEGNFLQFYDDIGVSTTKAGAEAYYKRDEELNKNFSQRSKEISKANTSLAEQEASWSESNKAIKSAEKKMPSSAKAAVDNAWAEAQKTFIPVQVTDPTGKKVEGTYLLPKESAIGITGQKGVSFAWYNVGKGKTVLNLHTKPETGQAIHDMLRKGTVEVKNKFYEKNMNPIAEQFKKSSSQLKTARTKLAEGRTSLDLAKGEISTAKAMLSGDKKIYNQSKMDMKNDYQEKLSTISSIFSKFKVEKRVPNAA